MSPRDKQQRGKTARGYGHTFERLIVRTLKERFKDRSWAEHVRRSDQTHKARLPDVTGWPGIWAECETAEQPNPVKKHAQAVRDAGKIPRCIPVAVIRKKRSQSIRVYLALDDLLDVLNTDEDWAHISPGSNPLVSMALEDFLDLYDSAKFDSRAGTLMWQLKQEIE